jgi:4-amino-4-deoxy-L-arabinose transferase-like glycosyltransferase
MPTAGREKREAIVTVTLLTVLAGVLRFTDLGLQSLWFDEALTAVVLEPSLVETFDRVGDYEATPPLYYTLAWLWTRVLGEGDVALRSLSALLGTATVPAAYAAGRQLVSHRAGLVTAALVAASPYLIWYSQEARAYALAALLATLSLVFIGRATRANAGRRDLVLWALTCSLLLASHYVAAVLVAAEGAWLIRERGLGRGPLAALAAPAATMLALLPLVLRQREDGLADWISEYELGDRIVDTARFFVGGFGGAPGAGRGLAAGLLGLAGVALLLWRGRGGERRGALVALGLAVAAATAALLLSLAGFDYVYHRNLLVLWVPLAIAAAAGFAAARAAGLVAAALLCAVFLSSHITTVRDSNRHREDWETAVHDLGRSSVPRPVAVAPPYANMPLIHYGLPVLDRPGDTVHTRELVVIGEVRDPGRLEPGRRIGPFRVVERHDYHRTLYAILRAEKPQPVELGPIDRADTLGSPQMHVLLDPGGG